ncbi:MAG: DUF2334 domain-containing protein [Candidatus Omnitrophica bacterium]|nr:DUF2334 domain-containing protein [Candidatus Omnitrophota bacterium]
MATPVFFLRDDDVFACDALFTELHRFFIKRDLSVVYGVIPAKMKKPFITQMLAFKKKHPYAFDIAQHGFCHADHHRRGKDKYEFGPGRSYRAQAADIQKGWSLLEKAFGAHAVPAFLPPYDLFDQNTLKAVDAAGLKIMSCGAPARRAGKKFVWLPVDFMMNDFKADGTPVALDAKTMLARLTARLPRASVTGIGFHHYAIRTKKEMAEAKKFFNALTVLRDRKEIKLVLLSDILRMKAFSCSRAN